MFNEEKNMKKAFASIAALLATTGASFANPNGCGAFGNCQPTAVPEISAMEGTAAVVALAAIVLLTWERRRRAS